MLVVFIDRKHTRMYLLACRPWICISILKRPRRSYLERHGDTALGFDWNNQWASLTKTDICCEGALSSVVSRAAEPVELAHSGVAIRLAQRWSGSEPRRATDAASRRESTTRHSVLTCEAGLNAATLPCLPFPTRHVRDAHAHRSRVSSLEGGVGAS